MNKSSAIPFQIPHFLVLLGIVLLGTICFIVIETSYREELRSQNLEYMWNRLPLVRERLKFSSLTHEKMLGGLYGINKITPQSAQLIARRWRQAFGPDIRYAIWSADFELITTHGFTRDDVKALFLVALMRLAMEDLAPQALRIQKRDYGWAMRHLFKKYESFLSHSPIDIRLMRLQNVPGRLLIGPWLPKLIFNKHSRNELNDMGIAPQQENNDCAGIVVLFVPEKVIKNPRWLQRALSLPTAQFGIPRVYLTSRQRLASNSSQIPGLSTELADKVLNESKTSSQGVVDDKSGTMAAFVTRPDWPPHIIAVYIENRFASSEPMTLSMAAIIAFLLISISSAVLLQYKSKTFSKSLFKQCQAISIAVSFIPLVGLAWMGINENRSFAQARRSEHLQNLESRLDRIENEHVVATSKLLKPIKQLLENQMWKQGLPSSSWIRSSISELRNKAFQTLYIVEADGTSHFFPREENTDERTKQVYKVMSAFLEYVQSMFVKHDNSPAGKNEELQRELKGSMIYDALTLAAGPESMYRLALTFDRLIPFQVFDEISLVIFHQVLDNSLKPIALLFAVIDHKLFILKELLQFVYNCIDTTREIQPIMLIRNERRELPMIFPIFLGLDPALNLVIHRLQENGNKLQTRLRVCNKLCDISAREIAGTDFLGIALEPVKLDGGLPVGIASIAIAYPIAMVFLALILFQTFFLKPVGEMRKTVEAIAAGNYDKRLPVLTDDELGDLCTSFNQMAQDLAEKEFLRRFISDLTMEAVAGRHSATATRTTATVMFSDIRGFTTLSENTPPEKITNMLNEYFTRMESAIEANGGTIDKFIGDAIMAVFLPTHGMAPSAERAVEAAFAMRLELAAFNEARKAAGEFTIANGYGIGTGEVLMGALGRSDGRQDFTITGPTVNIAATMEKRSKETRHVPIVVCPNTLKILGETYIYEKLPGTNGKPLAFELISKRNFENS